MLLDNHELTNEERIEHEGWMRFAIEEAFKAYELGEVPIGAIIVQDGKILAKGYNLRELNFDATGHAEIQAIKQANKKTQAWRLDNTTMYVTLEPCPMCAGALINSRVKKVIYGASDLKAGCAGTLMNLLGDSRFNHQVEVIRGVLAEECATLLSNFFKELRENKKQIKLSTE